MVDQRLFGLLMQGTKKLYAVSLEEPVGRVRDEIGSRKAGVVEASARNAEPGRVQRWYSWLVTSGSPSR